MSSASRVAGVVPAAGRGERLGGAHPKALRPVGGRPLLCWAVDALRPVCDVIVVAGPPGRLDEVAAVLPADVLVVAGGASRAASVLACLEALTTGPGRAPDHVLVHDAARPFTPTAVAERVLGALRAGRRAVVPVLPVADTVKQVDADGRVVATPDRASLRLVQTPQGFDAGLLLTASRRPDAPDATDDAGIVEAAGHDVWTVPGDPAAAKITTIEDLEAAESRALSGGGGR